MASDRNKDSISSIKKDWIKISTAAEIKQVDRQSIWYQVRNRRLTLHEIDGVHFVLRSEVMSMKVRAKNKPETVGLSLCTT